MQGIEDFAGAHLAGGGPTPATWMRRNGTRQTAVVGNKPQAPHNHQDRILPAGGGVSEPGRVHDIHSTGDRNHPAKQAR